MANGRLASDVGVENGKHYEVGTEMNSAVESASETLFTPASPAEPMIATRVS